MNFGPAVMHMPYCICCQGKVSVGMKTDKMRMQSAYEARLAAEELQIHKNIHPKLERNAQSTGCNGLWMA